MKAKSFDGVGKGITTVTDDMMEHAAGTVVVRLKILKMICETFFMACWPMYCAEDCSDGDDDDEDEDAVEGEGTLDCRMCERIWSPQC